MNVPQVLDALSFADWTKFIEGILASANRRERWLLDLGVQKRIVLVDKRFPIFYGLESTNSRQVVGCAMPSTLDKKVSRN